MVYQYPNGAYHYYPPGWDADPYVCQIFNDYVERIGWDGQRHVSMFEGRFVRLVEAQDAASDTASEGKLHAATP